MMGAWSLQAGQIVAWFATLESDGIERFYDDEIHSQNARLNVTTMKLTHLKR
jgi:hypothetical protein